jgi:hypothetical protein
MEHYVTLFDSLFLPQGLALHSSLEVHAGSYTLWVLCMDEDAQLVLDKLNKPNIKTIALSEIETPELLSVKPGRTKGEYCWTLTPFTPKIVFDRDESVQRVTYLDADLFFLKDVTPIFQEFEAAGKAVLITDHGYAPEHDQSATSGQFCVQFMTFLRDESEPVRALWQEKCVEWCFAKPEDGKFGDQKYLDDWPDRFPDLVHILSHQEWMLAPWNATRFPYSSGKIYHFQSLRILDDKYVTLGDYQLPNALLDGVYKPYLTSLDRTINDMKTIGCLIKGQSQRLNLSTKRKLMITMSQLLSRLADYKKPHVIWKLKL